MHFVRHVARRIGGPRVHDLCHPPSARCAPASGMRPRMAPTKGGRGCPSEGRGLVTSARADAPAEGAEGDAAADGHIRRTPAVRDAAPSLQVRRVRTAAMRDGRRRRPRRIYSVRPASCASGVPSVTRARPRDVPRGPAPLDRGAPSSRSSLLAGSPLPPMTQSLREDPCLHLPGRVTRFRETCGHLPVRRKRDEASRKNSGLQGAAGVAGGPSSPRTRCRCRLAGPAMPPRVRGRDRGMRRCRRPPPGMQEADAPALQDGRSRALPGCGRRRECDRPDRRASRPHAACGDLQVDR